MVHIVLLEIHLFAYVPCFFGPLFLDTNPTACFGPPDDIACSTPEFSRFCGWIEAAGLEAALDGSSNNELFSSLTVFAPTNVAIENYDLLGFSDSMFNNETDAGAIRDILLFHTIAGSVIESSAIDCSNSSSLSLTTANGGSAEISCALDGFVVTGDANANTTAAEAVVRITTPDVAACNGILHGIDGVVPSLPGTISPPGLDGPPPDVLPDDEDCQSFGTNETIIFFMGQPAFVCSMRCDPKHSNHLFLTNDAADCLPVLIVSSFSFLTQGMRYAREPISKISAGWLACQETIPREWNS